MEQIAVTSNTAPWIPSEKEAKRKQTNLATRSPLTNNGGEFGKSVTEPCRRVKDSFVSFVCVLEMFSRFSLTYFGGGGLLHLCWWACMGYLG